MTDESVHHGPLLSRQEAIRYLGLQDLKDPAQTISRLMSSGQLAYVEVTNQTRCFRRADLDDYISRRLQKILDPVRVRV